MKLRDVPTEKLIQALEATAKVAHLDSPSLVALRRELTRRQQAGRVGVVLPAYAATSDTGAEPALTQMQGTSGQPQPKGADDD